MEPLDNRLFILLFVAAETSLLILFLIGSDLCLKSTFSNAESNYSIIRLRYSFPISGKPV